jgi:hypothetical protein
MAVKFPGPEDRIYIIGRTGSGKTHAAMWHLSGHDFRTQPWLIVNTKDDRVVNWLCENVPDIKEISVDETPGESGLYVVTPVRSDVPKVDTLLGRVWDKQNCGVWIDEGYMIHPNDNFIGLLTQGRTRRIPMIVLTQRPAWITKFVESEADYVQVFNLSRRDDRKRVADVVHGLDVDYRLERHCSYWYNVADDDLVQFGPVANRATILESFRGKLPPEQALPMVERPSERQRPRII